VPKALEVDGNHVTIVVNLQKRGECVKKIDRCSSKGRQIYEYIRIQRLCLWPRKHDIGMSYCRILLHNM